MSAKSRPTFLIQVAVGCCLVGVLTPRLKAENAEQGRSMNVQVSATDTNAVNESDELFRMVVDNTLGTYAVVEPNKEVVTLKDKIGKVIWSVNVVEGGDFEVTRRSRIESLFMYNGSTIGVEIDFPPTTICLDKDTGKSPPKRRIPFRRGNLDDRGNAKQNTGDLDGAIGDNTKAIEFNPKYADAYRKRGNDKIAKKGDRDGAIADFSKAIELNPKLAGAYYDRSISKESKHDLDGAIADYTKAIGLEPKYANAYFRRGNAKKAKGDIAGAEKDLALAMKLSNPDVSYNALPPPK